MQKTFLKFVLFELVERVARFRLLLDECADSLHEASPGLKASLLKEADQLEESLLSQKAQLNKLFAEGGKQAVNLEPVLQNTYARLQSLSQLLLNLNLFTVEAETYLFLKDALPVDLTKEAGEQSVFLTAEGQNALAAASLDNVLIDTLPVLQKNNPLTWVGLTRAYSQYLLANASVLEALKLDLKKSGLKEDRADALILHALNLRLLGPAYYFHALTEAALQRDDAFLAVTEPALFFGLNHQNFTHKSLVILHEACDRYVSEKNTGLDALPEDVLSTLFRAIEKAVPDRAAFQQKNMDRAIQLQERLNQGILLSSTPLYPVDEVADVLEKKQRQADFSIYEVLSMMTEYPHSPREIVNAGWLHKVERGPVWLYSTLNEDREEGFARVLELLDYQDHLLRKSIETSEVHRVLCSV